MACSLEKLVVATSDNAGAAVEVVATSVYACSAKDVASDNDVASSKDACFSKGVYDSIDAVAVVFAAVFTPCTLIVYLLFFGLIISTKCHPYYSSRYQFTIQIKIVFRKEDHPHT